MGSCAQASELINTAQLGLTLDTYFRADLVSFKNVVTLDSHNKDDATTYLGIDYSFALSADFKDSGNRAYLKLERNGPYDYSAPIFIHNTLYTSVGQVEKYRGVQLLPQIEEFWYDAKVVGSFGVKAGLFIYEVGNGFALNGNYENYGLTLYMQTPDLLWRLYYCRPDLIYKYRLGPPVPQEKAEEQNYEPNAANFFATDAKLVVGKQTFWPYLGMLADYTSAGKRGDNIFTAPVDRDLLGTFGAAWEFKDDNFTLKLEAAHNFGYAQSANSDYKNITHAGYMFYTGFDCVLGKLVPELQFLVCSGNKATPEMAESGLTQYPGSRNRAFSYFSPTNYNLGDTISTSNVDMLPIVAMSGGYGLNYGVLRPDTFASGDFENLMMPSLGFDYNFTDKLCLSIYGYYLRSFTRPVGVVEGRGAYLSQDLGYEADVFVDYKFNKNITLGFLGGYYVPGQFYRVKRDDTEGSLFSPCVQSDGNVNNAYQIEFYAEMKF